MDLELFIILALIIVFLVSCCGLIQKIRENYEEDRGRVISVTQIHVPNQVYNNHAYQTGDEIPHGIFPAAVAPPPPPYTEHFEPPPKYEDLIKENQYTVIQMEQTTSGAGDVHTTIRQNEAGSTSTTDSCNNNTTADSNNSTTTQSRSSNPST